jgi:hypothetical protein
MVISDQVGVPSRVRANRWVEVSDSPAPNTRIRRRETSCTTDGVELMIEVGLVPAGASADSAGEGSKVSTESAASIRMRRWPGASQNIAPTALNS